MEWVKSWISDAWNFNVMIVWFQTISWFQSNVVMAKEIDKEFLILALSRVLSTGGGCAASHSSNFGEHWYLQLFLWRSNVFCVKGKDLVASIEVILNTPDAANMPLMLQRRMSLLWGWWRQYMWTWWSPFRTGRSTSMQFTYLQCEFAMLPEKNGSYLWNTYKLQKHAGKKWE